MNAFCLSGKITPGNEVTDNIPVFVMFGNTGQQVQVLVSQVRNYDYYFYKQIFGTPVQPPVRLYSPVHNIEQPPAQFMHVRPTVHPTHITVQQPVTRSGRIVKKLE